MEKIEKDYRWKNRSYFIAYVNICSISFCILPLIGIKPDDIRCGYLFVVILFKTELCRTMVSISKFFVHFKSLLCTSSFPDAYNLFPFYSNINMLDFISLSA